MYLFEELNLKGLNLVESLNISIYIHICINFLNLGLSHPSLTGILSKSDPVYIISAL